jgi:DNA-binding transcriptional LysR family regulator
MLSRLREALTDPLLVKHGNRMLATARAEELHAGVRDGLAQVRKSLQRVEPFHPRTSTREFVLYAPEYFEALLLPRLLDRMRSIAPNIRFKVEMSLDELPVDEAVRGTVDASSPFVWSSLSRRVSTRGALRRSLRGPDPARIHSPESQSRSSNTRASATSFPMRSCQTARASMTGCCDSRSCPASSTAA